MANQGLNLSLNEWRLIAEHRNISDYENKSAKDWHLEDQDQGLELKKLKNIFIIKNFLKKFF